MTYQIRHIEPGDRRSRAPDIDEPPMWVDGTMRPSRRRPGRNRAA